MRSNVPTNVPSEAPEGFSPTRRQVATAAAWSLPVIALAVAAPAASASNTAPVNSVGLTAAVASYPDRFTYGIGSIYNQNPSSPTVSTGTVTLIFTVPAEYVFPAVDQQAILNLGWIRVDSTGTAIGDPNRTSGKFYFQHAAVQGAEVITFPQVRFIGTLVDVDIIVTVKTASIGSITAGFSR